MSHFALRAAALLAVAGLALAACGNDKGAAPGLRAVKGVAGDLLKRGKDKAPPAPALPADVVAGTLARYVEAFRALTGADPVLPA